MNMFPTKTPIDSMTDNQLALYRKVINTSSKAELLAAGVPAGVVDELIKAAGANRGNP